MWQNCIPNVCCVLMCSLLCTQAQFSELIKDDKCCLMENPFNEITFHNIYSGDCYVCPQEQNVCISSAVHITVVCKITAEGE